MNFFRRISPFYIPPSTAQRGGLSILRERILQSMLIALTAFGMLLIIGSADVIYFEPLFHLPAIYLYIPVYSITLAITLARHLPYNLRAFALVHIIFILAAFELFENGQ